MRPNLEIGDIIFTQKKSGWINKLVRKMSTMPNEKPAKVEHVALGIGPDSMLEASVKGIKISYLSKYSKKKYNIKIARKVPLKNSSKFKILARANNMLNKDYGFLNIATHALDWIGSHIVGKEIFFFRNRIKAKNYPICSWYVVWALKPILPACFEQEIEYVQPEDINKYVNESEWLVLHNEL